MASNGEEVATNAPSGDTSNNSNSTTTTAPSSSPSLPRQQQEGGGEGGNFKILYFATAKLYIGKEMELLPAPLRVGALFDTLEERYSGIKDKVLQSCKVAVNWQYVDLEDGEDSQVIRAGDEVGIIPPVSSG